MKLVSFDALRTLNFPPHTVIKPEHMLKHQQLLMDADWVLYPPYWLINALVFGLKCRIFPSLSSYLIGHNKVEMTRAFELVAAENTPWTEIRANTPVQAEELWRLFDTPFVAKNIKSSMGEGVFLIDTISQWRQYCAQTDVLYVQEYLPIDRDLRIVLIGDQIIGGYWRLQSPYSFHNNLARGGEVVHGIMPTAALDLVSHLARRLAIDHAGFDTAMVGECAYVLEFNRLFGNQGLSQSATVCTSAIVSYLQQQLQRDFPGAPRGASGANKRPRRSA